MFDILVVEDDFSTRRLMEAVLVENGFHVHLAEDGCVALDILETKQVDLIVADIMMPNMDGYTLTGQLRDAGYTLPILMVTARESQKDIKKGFVVGTDDYMVKPVDEEEIVLRIRALLRRAQIVSERKITVGGVTLNYDSLTVSREGERVTLPQKEFQILFKLLSFPERIFTRMQLMEEIWGIDSQTDERTVDVHIKRLRDRFYTYPEFEIETVRGLGYKAVKNV